MAGGGGGGGEGSERQPGSRVLWSTPEGAVPEPVAVLRHPTLRGVYLVVAGGAWSVYRVGSPRALLSSPPAASAYSCGAWSPNRATVFYLGRTDGVMEAWDLIETLAGPAIAPVPVATSPLTSMLFRATAAAAAAALGGSAAGGAPTPAAAAAGSAVSPSVGVPPNLPSSLHNRQLAVGDAKGSVHIIEIPTGLRTPGAGEAGILTALLDREKRRVDFSLGRVAQLALERSARDAEEAAAATARAAAKAKDDEALSGASLRGAVLPPVSRSTAHPPRPRTRTRTHAHAPLQRSARRSWRRTLAGQPR
jgi:hypothetical protein